MSDWRCISIVRSFSHSPCANTWLSDSYSSCRKSVTFLPTAPAGVPAEQAKLVMLAQNEAAICIDSLQSMHLLALEDWRASDSQAASHVESSCSTRCSAALMPTPLGIAAATALVLCNSRCYYAYKTLRKALSAGLLPWRRQVALTRLLIRSKQVKSTELWAHHSAVMRTALRDLLPVELHAALPSVGAVAAMQASTMRGAAPCATQPALPATSTTQSTQVRHVDATATSDNLSVQHTHISADVGVSGELAEILTADFALSLSAATAHRRIAYAWQHRWYMTQACIAVAMHNHACFPGAAESSRVPHRVRDTEPAQKSPGQSLYRLQAASMKAVLSALLSTEEWLRLRPGDHSAWHWRWNTWRCVSEHKQALAAASSADCCPVLAALWSRELLFLAYVNSVHPEHSGLEAAARNATTAAWQSLSAASPAPMDSSPNTLLTALSEHAAPAARATSKENKVTPAPTEAPRDQEPESLLRSALWEGGPTIRPGWANGVLPALSPHGSVALAACAVLTAARDRASAAHTGQGAASASWACAADVAAAVLGPADWLDIALRWPAQNALGEAGV